MLLQVALLGLVQFLGLDAIRQEPRQFLRDGRITFWIFLGLQMALIGQAGPGVDRVGRDESRQP